MRCTICNAPDTKVIDSRLLPEGTTIRRRRKCETCNQRFTTYEKIEIQMPVIVKSDGRRENYQSEKIIKGIKKACQKRPISMEQIDNLISETEKNILEIHKKEIDANIIGQMIMENIYKLDPVAYVRFASFYWNFDNIDDFIVNLQKNLAPFKSNKNKGRSSHV